MTLDLHQKLKQKTREHHQKIEQTLYFNQIITSSMNIADYIALLKKLYMYISSCEATILTSPWYNLIMYREKANLLKDDLLSFGEYSDVINCTHQPVLESMEQVLGYLYVIEGSTLGGQVIAKALKQNLRLTPQTGASYFNGYGKQTLVMWEKFCQELQDVQAHQEESVINSACLTYTTLSNWMNTRQECYE